MHKHGEADGEKEQLLNPYLLYLKSPLPGVIMTFKALMKKKKKKKYIGR